MLVKEQMLKLAKMNSGNMVGRGSEWERTGQGTGRARSLVSNLEPKGWKLGEKLERDHGTLMVGKGVSVPLFK